ncbi:MAG: methyltransferase [Kiritimatiellia bacterium]
MNPNRIVEMASAFYESCVLFAASDAGIFAWLGKTGPANAETIAVALKLDVRGARLLLDACVALELLRKDGDLYSNTPESGAFLVPGRPGDLSGAIRYNRDVYPAWGRLKELAATGKPVEKPEVHLGQDPERTRTFVMAMHGRALAIGQAVVPMLDLANAEKLLDVGSGPGTYSVLIAKANPGLRCTMLDLPDVVAIASELVREQGMQNRIDALPGDYRTTAFPGGNDVVNFFGVLHQESPDSIRSLFKKAFAALKTGGRVNVMDMMTDATRAAPRFSALFAVNMALTTENGWVFSDAELKQWLEEAGFKDCAVRPLPPPMPHWLMTACK